MSCHPEQSAAKRGEVEGSAAAFFHHRRETRESSGNLDPGKLEWRPRDFLAAALLFLATAAFVLWQNSRVAVLWDLGYLLDTGWRIALGQVPYRDFPFAHAPLTFLLQAGLIRLGGRHYFLPIVYSALAGALATVLTWRILLLLIRGNSAFGRADWWMALLMSVPLPLLGIYSVYPHPIYDGDCILSVLIALLLLVRPQFAQPRVVAAHAFSGCERKDDSGEFLKGHGFSRAATATK